MLYLKNSSTLLPVLAAYLAMCMAPVAVAQTPDENPQSKASKEESLALLKLARALVADGKKKGLIGESATGYLDYHVWDDCPLTPPSLWVKDCKFANALYQAVIVTNKIRKSIYQKRADDGNVDIRSAAESSGIELISNAISGEMVKPLTGPWRKVR